MPVFNVQFSCSCSSWCEKLDNLEGHFLFNLFPKSSSAGAARSCARFPRFATPHSEQSNRKFVHIPGRDCLKSYESRGEKPNNAMAKRSSSCTHTGHTLAADNDDRNSADGKKMRPFGLESAILIFFCVCVFLILFLKNTHTNKHHSNTSDLLWCPAYLK